MGEMNWLLELLYIIELNEVSEWNTVELLLTWIIYLASFGRNKTSVKKTVCQNVKRCCFYLFLFFDYQMDYYEV